MAVPPYISRVRTDFPELWGHTLILKLADAPATALAKPSPLTLEFLASARD